MGRFRSQFFCGFFGLRSCFFLSALPLFAFLFILPQQTVLSQDLSSADTADSDAGATQSITPTVVACVPLPSGAVAWWRAESNSIDSVGINDGLLQLARLVTPYTTGKVGQAFFFPPPTPMPPISFLGTTNYMFVPPSPDLDLGQGRGLTIEGWVKPTSTNGVQPILEWNDGHENIGAGLALNGSALQGYLAKTNPLPIRRIAFSSPSNLIATQSWQHVALTWDKDSGFATIYLNGSQVGQTNLGVFAPQTLAPIYMAFQPAGISGRGFYVGGIDEMTIYNRALSQAELQSIVNADGAGKCVPPPASCFPVPSGIVGWWRAESNTVDSVDGNNGLVVPTVTYGDGEVGKAFLFSDGYVHIPAASNLNVGSGPGFTIETWVAPPVDSPVASLARQFVGWQSGVVGVVTQGVGLSIVVNATNVPLVSASPVWQANIVDTDLHPHVIRSPEGLATPDVYQHVAVTYDKTSGIAALYFNGNAVTQANLGTFTPRTTTDLNLGFSSAIVPIQRGSGALDETSIYARALTPPEIRAIMLARSAGKCKEPPAIKTQPVSDRINLGDTISFSVTASGNPILRYQWRRNETNLPGATSTSLTLTNVQLAQAGAYSVRVTNAFGSVTSSNAVLTVNRAPIADASATQPLVLAPLNCDGTVVLDGSRSSDPDDDPLNFFWFHDGTTTPLATGAVAVVKLPPGTYSLALAVDDGLATNTAAFTVQVIAPSDAIQNLMDLVDAQADKPNPLDASLRAAEKSVDRGHVTPAINQLGAFQHKVDAQVDDPALAQNFTQAAQQIIDILGVDCAGEKPQGHIGKISRASEGKSQIQFTAPAGYVYIIEASTNLVDWEKIGVATNSDLGAFQFEDPSGSSSPSRFYRIVVP